MKCPRCQHANREGHRFCTRCGGSLARTCAACGFVNGPIDQFCGGCGTSLTSAPEAAPPGSYTPPYLAEKILRSRTALEGERKQVTVLFADVTRSMELLVDRDPEDARRLLDPVIERMMEAIHRYEGTVNQVMGDGIMALFGAPVAHEDHAVRACYAALRIQESVAPYGDEMLRSHGLPIQMRVGLNSGEVVVRSIGSDLHMDYTAVGQTTHLAARMEQIARPGSIFITDATLKLAEDCIRVRSLGPVPVKGLGTPVETYELLGVAAVRSRLHASVAKGLTRFVGRDAELQLLHLALERAAAGHGQVVGVVGEPGVGKTRLFYEFTRALLGQTWLLLETSGVSYGRSTPYLPVIELLRAYFKAEEGDDPRDIGQRVVSKLLALDPALEPTVPPILALLDVSVDDPGWRTLDPQQRRQRTLEAIRRLLLRESLAQPLCLVVENLHWIDSETQAVLDSLVAGLPAHRVTLLVNYRPEFRHRWNSKTYYTQFRIDPLTRASVEAILQDVLGPNPGLSHLRELLIAKAEGNPFFLEECLRTLVETRVLAGRPGAYRPATPVPSIQVPATVQAVLAARMDRLAPDEKHLLQSAAVIGKDVPLATLARITELPEDVIRQRLTRLQTAEFLYESRTFPSLEYTFKHALTHEVAYGSLLHDRRQHLHALVVEAIETAHPGRLAEHVERLAYHAFRGEVWEKAVTYLREAGVKAFARAAHREAAERFAQAMAALERLPRTREAIEQAIDLRLHLRNSLLPVGEVEAVMGHLRDAEALAASVGDRRRAGWVAGYLSAGFWALGDYVQALDAARHARQLAIELGDVSLRVYASVALTWPHHSRGEYRAGIAAATEALDLLRVNPGLERLAIPSRPAVLARTWLVSCLAEVGEFALATPLADEAVRLAEAAGEPWSLVDAYLGLGVLAVRRGDIAMATAVLARGLDVSRRFTIPVWFPPLAASLGYACALSGNLGEARGLLEDAVERATATKVRFYHSLGTIWLGETHLVAGRWADARRCAADALELCERYGEAGNRAYTLRLLAEIAARSADEGDDAAQDRYQEALALAGRLEMRPLAVQCHLGLGDLASRRQRWVEAREQLAVALELSRKLGMAAAAQRASAALERVPPTP